ncbi:hypothetical protein MH1LPH_24400 [Lactiplantibacillus brownii]
MSKSSKTILGIIYIVCTIIPPIILIFQRELIVVGGIALLFFAYLGWFIFLKQHTEL